jgi:group I intron endonuclease
MCGTLSLPGIYAIRNIADGRNTTYIGQSSSSVLSRWKTHTSYLKKGTHHSSHLQGAWNKYGQDAFRIVVIENIEEPELLTEREQFWLDKTREIVPVYNWGAVARTPFLGMKHRPESIKKLSDRMFGKKLSDETKKKIQESNRKIVRSDEFRKKVSAGMKIFCSNENARQRINPPSHLGHRHSEETKNTLSEASRAYAANHPITNEMREKLSASATKAWKIRKSAVTVDAIAKETV